MRQKLVAMPVLFTLNMGPSWERWGKTVGTIQNRIIGSYMFCAKADTIHKFKTGHSNIANTPIAKR
jgi:hypothetical protein